jgi:methionine-rich copper-binding protein CopC
MRMVVFLAAVAVLIAGGFMHAVAPPAAHAHAAFITSDPAPDSIISEMPEHLTLVFSERVLRSAMQVVITAPDGAVISDEISVDGNRVTVTLTPAGPGTYEVWWSNVSADDGHQSEGLFHFTVEEEGE